MLSMLKYQKRHSFNFPLSEKVLRLVSNHANVFSNKDGGLSHPKLKAMPMAKMYNMDNVSNSEVVTKK